MARRALLVGINEYRVKPLRGCLNDVSDIAAFLQSGCGFEASEIKPLTEADATRDNIRRLLETWLLPGAVEGDRLLFHFSGHGTRLPRSDDRVHDVICPYDFDFDSRNALSASDFQSIFAALPAGVTFNWISDSCHSGDLARPLQKSDVVTRYLPPPPDIEQQIERILARRSETRSLSRAMEHLNGVLIAGCRSDQESADTRIDGRFNGALTHYLLKELHKSEGLQRAIGVVVDDVRQIVERNGYNQTPQVRGHPDLVVKPFMGGSSVPVPAGMAATAAISAAARVAMTTAAAGPNGGLQPGKPDQPHAATPAIGKSNPSATKEAVAPTPSKRVALVIGNSRYPKGKLRHPENDAALITRKLGEIGFRTIVGGAGEEEPGRSWNGVDLGVEDMRKRVREFIGAIKTGGTAVIYYAGHGIQVGDKNFLVPVDAKLESRDPLKELISLDDLIAGAVSAAGASGRVLVFLDACRVNPFTPTEMSNVAAAFTRSVKSSATPQTYVPTQGLGRFKVDSSENTAREFIAYATSPGEVAYDGRPGDGNSPFARALARHITVRGLTIDELSDRVGRDVEVTVKSMNSEWDQDPWKATNLKVPFQLKPMSWWPVPVLGLLGGMAGLVTSFLLFQGNMQDRKVVDPVDFPLAWAYGLIFAAVVGFASMQWGGAGKSRISARAKLVDVLFAVTGTALAFALALSVLQLIDPVKQASPSSLGVSMIVYDKLSLPMNAIAVAGGILMLLATVLGWRHRKWTVGGYVSALIEFVLPFLLVITIISLKERFIKTSETGIGVVFVSLIAGALFTAGTALALKPQRGVFRGFGALTGAITVGLLMALFFDVYYRLPSDGLLDRHQVSLVLGALWFALFGAQLGYCFAYYVPEYEPPTRDR